jgi:alpha-beta hydrolase superfamily lysophospholipase
MVPSSNHNTNWEFVKPLLEQQFTVYAIARRGRGKTDATEGHSLDDESMDVVTLIQAIDLLGGLRNYLLPRCSVCPD